MSVHKHHLIILDKLNQHLCTTLYQCNLLTSSFIWVMIEPRLRAICWPSSVVTNTHTRLVGFASQGALAKAIITIYGEGNYLCPGLSNRIKQGVFVRR
jgi:hypothetical protein